MAPASSHLLAAAAALAALAPARARAESGQDGGSTPPPAAQPDARPEPPSGPPGERAAAPVARPDDRPAAPAAQAGERPAAPVDAPQKPTRRGGFMLGVDAGFGVASIVGYPNDVTKIGYVGGYTATGARPAGMIEPWIGGPFTDWFTFGLGFHYSALADTDRNKARMFGGLFRVEAFPLFALGGPFRDLGARIDVGLGTASVVDPGGNKLVDGSFASIIGGGFFWEGLRAWKTSHGPFLAGNYLWSDTARRPAIFLGWRSVLYTKP